MSDHVCCGCGEAELVKQLVKQYESALAAECAKVAEWIEMHKQEQTEANDLETELAAECAKVAAWQAAESLPDCPACAVLAAAAKASE